MSAFVQCVLGIFTVLVGRVCCNTFIWEPNSPGTLETWKRPYPTFSSPAICVNIPANLSLCHGIKYSQMRLPNLLHHDTLNEVIEQSESWIQLTKISCHPDTQLFLCSLFTPVCLDQTIPPCRSLCESVKTGCEPFMIKHGYNWPSIMQCHQFPVDNNMCIQSQANKIETSTHHTTPHPIYNEGSQYNKPHRTNQKHQHNQDKTDNFLSVEDEKFINKLVEAICNSDWVIKSGVSRIRSKQVRIKKFKVIYGNINSTPPFILPVNQTNVITASSDNGKKKSKYIIVGNGQENNLQARLLVCWAHNTAQIKKALRSAKSGQGCQKLKSQTEHQTTSRKQTRGRNRKRNQNNN